MRGAQTARQVFLYCCLIVGTSNAAPLPGPAPQHRSQSAMAMNRDCETCHQEITREWRESFHARSYVDPAFQRALRKEPRPFCRACHAPEADPLVPAIGWAAESGVACVTCHVLDDQVVSGPPRKNPGAAPHLVKRDSRFVSEEACARCHEFSFPDGHARTRPELMQSTVTEHQRSQAAERGCASCHMPHTGGNGGHRSHRFLGGHDPDLLRRSLAVSAQRPSGTTLRLTLVPTKVGHAFPTGDLFRRLMIHVSSVTASGEEQTVRLRYLTRHLATEQQLVGKRVLVTRLDDRLHGRTTLDLDIAERYSKAPLRWRIVYQRVIFPDSAIVGAESIDGATLDGEIVLDSGVIPP